jgi:hypothetical protein
VNYFENAHKQSGDPGTMTIADFAKWLKERDAFVHIQVYRDTYIVDVNVAHYGKAVLDKEIRSEAPTLEEALRLAMHDVDARLLKEERK